MKSILISIKPEWVAKILNGDKTIEMRKTTPKTELPCKVYIYCTKEKSYMDRLVQNHNGFYFTVRELVENDADDYGLYYDVAGKNSEIVAEFTLSKVKEHKFNYIFENPETYEEEITYNFAGEEMKNAGFENSWEFDEFLESYGKSKTLYAWHIDNLKIYSESKELSRFSSLKECKPTTNIYGEKQIWEQRHKRCIASSHGIPIECFGCKNLIQHKDYLDEASGVMLFDYSCKTNYHKPLSRPPQSWCYVEEYKK